MAHAQNLYVAADGNKTQSIPTDITTPPGQHLEPVPEPSAASLILLGLGGVGLAMKLRKRS
jgi:hypothetical protein